MRLAILAIAAFGVTMCGCAREHVVWYGRTPDRVTEVRVIERGKLQSVAFDGQLDAPHDAVGIEGLALTPAARAYPVLDGARWRIVRDGVMQEGAWDAVGDVRLSPNGRHLAFSVLEHGEWSVIADAVHGSPFVGIVRGSLFIDDRGRTSFAARRKDGVWVFDGGAIAGPFRVVRGLRRGRETEFVGVASDGERVFRSGVASEPFDEVTEWIEGGFVARRGDVVVVDVYGRREHEGGPAGALSIRGSHFAYVVDARDGERIVRDGHEEKVSYDAVLATAVAGDRFGCLARRGNDEIVAIDGVETGAWAWATPPIFSDDGSHWGYVASMGAGALVVTDRGRRAYDVVLTDTLAFDARGHTGAVVGFASNHSVWIAIDGAPRVRVDLEEWAGEALRTRHIDMRAWVRAELARLP
jgi:hypothetical protein